MKFAYSCNIVPDEEAGEGFVVTFPDVKEAITGARTFKESLVMAEDGLLVALCMYMDCNGEIPSPSPLVGGQELIAVPPLYSAMRRQEISQAKLAERLSIDESAVHKLLIPGLYSHMKQVAKPSTS